MAKTFSVIIILGVLFSGFAHVVFPPDSLASSKTLRLQHQFSKKDDRFSKAMYIEKDSEVKSLIEDLWTSLRKKDIRWKEVVNIARRLEKEYDVFVLPVKIPDYRKESASLLESKLEYIYSGVSEEDRRDLEFAASEVEDNIDYYAKYGFILKRRVFDPEKGRFGIEVTALDRANEEDAYDTISQGTTILTKEEAGKIVLTGVHMGVVAFKKYFRGMTIKTMPNPNPGWWISGTRWLESTDPLLHPLENVKIFVDDLTDTLMYFEEGNVTKKGTPVIPAELILFYKDHFKKGGIQVIVTGDRLKDAMIYWTDNFSKDERGRIFVLSLSSMECYGFDDESEEPFLIFNPTDFFNDRQKKNWDFFRKEWKKIFMETAGIYLGELREYDIDDDAYYFEKGRLDDRYFQISMFAGGHSEIGKEHNTISQKEAEDINRKTQGLAIAKAKEGDLRQERMIDYLKARFEAARLSDLGFNPTLKPVRNKIIDSCPVTWNKGTGLLRFKEMGLSEKLLESPIDWAEGVEIHGDGFATSNDRDMAEVFPDTYALSVGPEDEVSKFPDNVELYNMTDNDGKKMPGPLSLADNLIKRKYISGSIERINNIKSMIDLRSLL